MNNTQHTLLSNLYALLLRSRKKARKRVHETPESLEICQFCIEDILYRNYRTSAVCNVIERQARISSPIDRQVYTWFVTQLQKIESQDDPREPSRLPFSASQDKQLSSILIDLYKEDVHLLSYDADDAHHIYNRLLDLRYHGDRRAAQHLVNFTRNQDTDIKAKYHARLRTMFYGK